MVWTTLDVAMGNKSATLIAIGAIFHTKGPK